MVGEHSVRHILHVVPNLQRHGTQTFIMNVFRNIDKEKLMFDFLVIGDDKEGFYEEIIHLGGKVFYVSIRRNGFIEYHKQLNRFFKEHAREFSSIHLQSTTLSSLAPVYYAKKHGIKNRIMHINGAGCVELHNKYFHYINRLRLPFIANRFLSCSKEASLWGYGHTPVLNQSQFIPNGIDLKKFSFDQNEREKKREELGIPQSKIVLFHAGYFQAIKNHRFLIEIMQELSKRKLDVTLLLAGDGELLEKIKDYSKQLGVYGIVKFLGNISEIPSLLSASDIMVFPSYREGLGLIAIEAQANGLPVIASTGIPKEAAISDLFHRIHLSDGVIAWADKIEEVYSLHRCHENNPQRLDEYSIEHTVKLLTNIYLSDYDKYTK